MGCFNSLDYVYDTFPLSTVVGVPVGGFYFSNEWPYSGADDNPAIEYIPWSFTDLKDYLNLWDAYVPTRCAEAKKDAQHECIIAEGLYGSLAAPVFVVEVRQCFAARTKSSEDRSEVLRIRDDYIGAPRITNILN